MGRFKIQKSSTMKTKKCTKCNEEKPATTEFFYKNKREKSGLSSQCKICRQKYFDSRKEAKSEYDKKYRKKNGVKLNNYRNQYYKDNKEKLNAYRKEHYESNKEAYIANSAKRKADKRNQTPEFANTKLIARIYFNCPEGYHVEHMLPINRAGLHHENNLCYLPASINMAKSDKTIEEYGQEDFHSQAIYWQDIL